MGDLIGCFLSISQVLGGVILVLFLLAILLGAGVYLVNQLCELIWHVAFERREKIITEARKQAAKIIADAKTKACSIPLSPSNASAGNPSKDEPDHA